VQIAFSQHPPSVQWEPLPVPRLPGLMLWGWYRPQHLPSGMTIQIPPEVTAASQGGFPFTLGEILLAAGVDPMQLHSVSLFGAEWQPAAMITPYLQHAVPPCAPGIPAEIAVNVTEQMAGNWTGMPQQVPAATDAVAAEEESTGTGAMMYDRIESAWKVSLQMERQMSGLRKKLASVMKSLGKLDRELTPEERLASDREDRDAWQDARRWVRELSAKCHRELKSFDIGMTSGAGRRNAMEQLFKEVIEPRVPSNDLQTIHRDFETYRKDMTNLQKSMTAALQAASQNGTSRAQRILGTISRKIKARRAKLREPIGGTNMDKSVRRKS